MLLFRVMSTHKLFRLFLWRTVLLGTVLGAAFGTTVGVLMGERKFSIEMAQPGAPGPGSGFILAIFFFGGAFWGTFLGFLSGLTNSVLLSILTLSSYNRTGERRYYRRSGYACAGTSILVSFLALWIFQGGLSPEDFLTQPLDPFNLVLFAITLALMFCVF